ncbi:Pentatricopeptide repeat-containing protein [Raphanus sativus]|uniref:Pentatricopeptide repeat-containing protein At3g58590-like n=1 Tax=Raphanus sativus TaxID=3726 RepID=A0A6J0N2N9_RAPSA|nr:pentatricopeptide repeat-containing protein At3g58590-like [Raphanus sativus]KAJ4905372.1 Pentatricopeptide repeat-containing protein [Raphanus sativus]
MSLSYRELANPNNRLLSLLDSCSKAPSFTRTKALHALSITLWNTLQQPVYICNNVISLYAKLGEVCFAAKVFDQMPERDRASFNMIISGFSKSGYVERAWRVFSEMREFGFSPNQLTVRGLLSCPSLDLRGGTQLHGLSLKYGLFMSDAYVGTKLLGLYGRFELLETAEKVFEDMPLKSLVTWNHMMSLLGRGGFLRECMFLFRELVGTGECLSESSFLGALTGVSCENDLETSRQLHCSAMKIGLDCDTSIVNSLISAYGRCGNTHMAERVFDEAASWDIVSWNAVIGATAKGENPLTALKLFVTMPEHELSPNLGTYVSVLTASSHTQTLSFGRQIHGTLIKNGCETDIYLGNALIDFYGKCGSLEDSRLCFDSILDKNIVCWNTLLWGYANKDDPICLSLVLQMLQMGFRPTEYTLSTALKPCCVVELQQLHSVIVRMGYEDNDYVLSSLMRSYAKNQLMNDALLLLDWSSKPSSVVPLNIAAGIYSRTGQYRESVELISTLEQPDNVSWNIAIAAWSRSATLEQPDTVSWNTDNHGEEVTEIFKHILQANIRPDNFTYVSILCTCAKFCDLTLGSSIHGLITKTDFSRADTFVCNVLIDMYGKCGSVTSAIKVFEETREKNIITWTALISSLGIHGYGHEAFEKFEEMVSLGFKPDCVSFISVLTACRHSGMVKEGMELFWKMKDYGVEPDIDHYRCAVDLLARNGYVIEAEQLISRMPFPADAPVWRTVLAGSKSFAEEQRSTLSFVSAE